MIRRILTAMEDHDTNEERRYLSEGRRWNLCWGWFYLSWGVGANVHFSCYPNAEETFNAWVTVGPLTIELYRSSAP